MIDKRLVGRCGLYCGACIIYRAYKDSEELRKKIAEDNNCDIDDVKCHGCQSSHDDKWKEDDMWGDNCEIVDCLDKKELTYCYECDEYPDCERYQRWAETFSRDGEDVKANLDFIKKGNSDVWLEKEKERWSCSKCGKPISMVLDECHWCGGKITM